MALSLSSCGAAPHVPGEKPTDSGGYVIQQWTTADGLPVNYVRGMVWGEEVYLWLKGASPLG